MDKRSQKGEEKEILELLKEIQRGVYRNGEQLKEVQQDVEYLVDILKRYLVQVERGKKVESIILNSLFFALGLLLGFTLAFFLFKF